MGAAKDLWDKWEVGAKVAIPVVAALVGAAFALIQDAENRRSTEARYFTDLLAQRERADSDLRTAMFKMLIDAYFGDKLQQGSSATPSRSVGESTVQATEPELGRIKEQVIFAHLLARNFDNVDVRPLFEDLDGRLSRIIQLGKPLDTDTGSDEIQLREQAFALREELRRVAIGVSSRQASGLGGLEGGSNRVFSLSLCPPRIQILDTPGYSTLVNYARDGVLDLKILPPLASTAPTAGAGSAGGSAAAGDKIDAGTYKQDIPLRVTFYDMPVLENFHLPDGKRVAFTLRRYLSYQSCRDFSKQMDESLQTECSGLLAAEERCDQANVVLTEIPASYVGVRDRPYVNELIAGQYSAKGKD